MEAEMAIQPPIKPDTQPTIEPDGHRRTDEYKQEYTATEGVDMTIEKDRAPTALATVSFDHLFELVGRSANAVQHAAQGVENRGLKLFLKVMAQERLYMLDELHRTSGQHGLVDDAEKITSSTSLRQGMDDIQTSMAVQRGGREELSLTKLLNEEEELLAAYAAALESNVPNALKQTLEAQWSRVSKFHAQLQKVAHGEEPIVARVFDTRIEGEHAITRLQSSGLSADQIDSALISRLEQPIRASTTAPPSRSATTMGGAVSGGLVGGLFGLAVAAFIWLAPDQWIGWVTVSPWLFLIGALVIGALFGAVFGLIIGQNRREDDLMVTADGLINGEILVAAYPSPAQVSMVEDILQVHHARELGR
jgi:hypothetical protein